MFANLGSRVSYLIEGDLTARLQSIIFLAEGDPYGERVDLRKLLIKLSSL